MNRSTDLRRRAHLLHRTHEAMLTGHALPTARAPLWPVLDSDASRRARPGPASAGDPVGVDVLERRRCSSRLHGALPGLRASLAAIADEAEHIMVVTDVDGVVLWRDGCKARRSGDAAVESVVESKDLFAEVGPCSQRCQVLGQCW